MMCVKTENPTLELTALEDVDRLRLQLDREEFVRTGQAKLVVTTVGTDGTEKTATLVMVPARA